MATEDKLTYLNNTKGLIKQAIEAKGVPVSTSTTFRQYAAKISLIGTNGGAPPKGDMYMDTTFVLDTSYGSLREFGFCAVISPSSTGELADAYIDWGDGEIELVTSGATDHYHTYKSEGVYILRIMGQVNFYESPAITHGKDILRQIIFGSDARHDYNGSGLFSDLTSLIRIAGTGTGPGTPYTPIFADEGVGESMFGSCDSLRDIDIFLTGDIQTQAFAYCGELRSVRFSDCNGNYPVSHIREYSFEGTDQIQLMVVDCQNPPILENDAFETDPLMGRNEFRILIPHGTLNYYESEDNWSDFAGRFVEMTFPWYDY